MTAPSPNVSSLNGWNFFRGSNVRPMTFADSMIAVRLFASHHQSARMGRCAASTVLREVCFAPKIPLRTWPKPSPPSLIGKSSSESDGRALRQPRSIASAAAGAASVPLNLSGTIKTFIDMLVRYCPPKLLTIGTLIIRKDWARVRGAGNIEHRTSNIERPIAGNQEHSVFGVRGWTFDVSLFLAHCDADKAHLRQGYGEQAVHAPTQSCTFDVRCSTLDVRCFIVLVHWFSE